MEMQDKQEKQVKKEEYFFQNLILEDTEASGETDLV